MGAVLGATPADQISSHAECGRNEPRLGSDVPLGSEIRALWGGAWGHFVVGWGDFSGQWGLIGTAVALCNFFAADTQVRVFHFPRKIAIS